jgi:hypothetical protein
MASQRKSKSITTTVVSLIPGHGEPKQIKVYHNSCESPGIRITTVVIDFDFLRLAMTRNQTHNCCGGRLWFPLACHDQESDSQLWSWQAKGNQSLSPQQLWVWFLVMASQRKSKSTTTTVVSLIPGHGEPKEIKVYHNSCESDSWSWRAKGNQSLSPQQLWVWFLVMAESDSQLLWW